MEVSRSLDNRDAEIIFGGKVVTVLDIGQQAAEDLFESVKKETQAKIAWCFLGGEFHLFHIGGPESRKKVKEAVKSFIPSEN